MATTASEYRTRIDELELALEAAKRRGDQLETRAMQAEAEAEKTTIISHLRVAAYLAGSTDAPPGKERGPIDDVVDNALRSGKWKLDSKGKLLRVREDGHADMTTDGQYIPISAWMREHRKEFPSYFPNADQADAPKSTSSRQAGGADVSNPWTAAGWNQQRQNEYQQQHGLEKATAAAAAAGVSVYASKPASSASQISLLNPWSAAGWSPERQRRMKEINMREAGLLAEAAGSSLNASSPPSAD
jgi:hypothetical protein